MPWHLLAFLAADTGGTAPLDSAVSQILGYGVLGIVTLAFAFRFIVPRSAVEDARKQARADLIAQVERLEKLIEELHRDKKTVEEQRDDAQQFTTSQLVPLLVQFTSATSALIPLLQELVRNREAGNLDIRRWQR